MTIETELAALTTAVSNLTDAVNVKKAALDDAVAEANKERRHAWAAPYSYCGTAPDGTLDAEAFWTIKRITVASDGSVTVATATNVAWTNRATATYA
jgi:hypothetical protein